MALTYGFFNSFNGDRKYSAEQISSIFEGLITDGVYATIGDIFATIPGDGLQVIVKSGKAWFDRTWTWNDSPMPVSIDDADITLPRIDAVVLEVDHSLSERKNSIKIVKGTPRSTPLLPTLTNDGTIAQHPLAYVTVQPAAISISASDIDIRVGKTDCPFVTGILAMADITDLFNQWEADFQAWWDNIKLLLNDDTVGHLQNQIDALSSGKTDVSVTAALQAQVNSIETRKVNVSDKANSAEVISGTNDTKWTTPAGIAAAINLNGGFVYFGETKTNINSIAPLPILVKESAFSTSYRFTDDLKYIIYTKTSGSTAGSISVIFESYSVENPFTKISTLTVTTSAYKGPTQTSWICDRDIIVGSYATAKENAYSHFAIRIGSDGTLSAMSLSGISSSSENGCIQPGVSYCASKTVGGYNPTYIGYAALNSPDGIGGGRTLRLYRVTKSTGVAKMIKEITRSSQSFSCSGVISTPTTIFYIVPENSSETTNSGLYRSRNGTTSMSSSDILATLTNAQGGCYDPVNQHVLVWNSGQVYRFDPTASKVVVASSSSASFGDSGMQGVSLCNGTQIVDPATLYVYAISGALAWKPRALVTGPFQFRAPQVTCTFPNDSSTAAQLPMLVPRTITTMAVYPIGNGTQKLYYTHGSKLAVIKDTFMGVFENV